MNLDWIYIYIYIYIYTYHCCAVKFDIITDTAKGAIVMSHSVSFSFSFLSSVSLLYC